MSVNVKQNGELVKTAGLYKQTVPLSVAEYYSTEEHKVGVWVDGKPLYQKSFYVSALPSSAGSMQVTTGLTGIDMCKLAKGWSKGFGELNIVRCESTNAITYGVGCWVAVADGVPTINIEVGRDRSTLDAWITLQYTKTSDNATGGVYAPIIPMQMASKYSTEEKVIGEWIDHKPLYQRTFDCGALPNATSKSISISSIGIDKVVGFDAVGIDTATPDIIPIPVKTPNTSSQWGVSVQCYQNSIYLDTKANMSQYNAYVTLRYTKTTDTAGTGLYSDDEATLGMLGDVEISNPTDGQFIVYNGTTHKWGNVTVASAESEAF